MHVIKLRKSITKNRQDFTSAPSESTGIHPNKSVTQRGPPLRWRGPVPRSGGPVRPPRRRPGPAPATAPETRPGTRPEAPGNRPGASGTRSGTSGLSPEPREPGPEPRESGPEPRESGPEPRESGPEPGLELGCERRMPMMPWGPQVPLNPPHPRPTCPDHENIFYDVSNSPKQVLKVFGIILRPQILPVSWCRCDWWEKSVDARDRRGPTGAEQADREGPAGPAGPAGAG
jgi:hypothetical protein